jgi:hypothetical protein
MKTALYALEVAPGQQRTAWEDRAKRSLKAELKRADVSHRKLANRLKKHGLDGIRS